MKSRDGLELIQASYSTIHVSPLLRPAKKMMIGMKTMRIKVPRFLLVNCCIFWLLLCAALPSRSSLKTVMLVRMPSPVAVLAIDSTRLLTSACLDICTMIPSVTRESAAAMPWMDSRVAVSCFVITRDLALEQVLSFRLLPQEPACAL